MEITYLPADASDIAPILEQSLALVERYEDFATIDKEKVFAWLRRKTEKRIGEYTRILCDGETAGWIRACDHGEKLELDDLFILEPFQNRGIGSAVLRKYLTESEKPVFLYVFTRNTGALRLYERLGFHVREQVGETRLIMEQAPGKQESPLP